MKQGTSVRSKTLPTIDRRFRLMLNAGNPLVGVSKADYRGVCNFRRVPCLLSLLGVLGIGIRNFSKLSSFKITAFTTELLILLNSVARKCKIKEEEFWNSGEEMLSVSKEIICLYLVSGLYDRELAIKNPDWTLFRCSASSVHGSVHSPRTHTACRPTFEFRCPIKIETLSWLSVLHYLAEFIEPRYVSACVEFIT